MIDKPHHYQCASCRFYQGGQEQPMSPDEYGECWRYPPTVILECGERTEARPVMGWNETCGEYSRRTAA
jgi:hypothetical protein